MTPTARRAAIRAARERAAKAIEGPWHNYDTAAYGVGKRDDSARVRRVRTGERPSEDDRAIALVMDTPTATFIAHARTDIPALADDADRYHDLVERVEAEIRACENHAAQARSLSRTGVANRWITIAERMRNLLTPGEPS